MPLKHKENVLTTVEDIQRLASKDPKNILQENAIAQGGNKADLVMKVCNNNATRNRSIITTR